MIDLNPERSPRRYAATGVPSMLRASWGRAGRGALVAFGLLALGAAAGPATALALPAGRVYEMVSPVYKGGYGAGQIQAVAENGESVVFFSSGAFAGAPAGQDKLDYIARRSASGWSTTPMMAPGDVLADEPDMDISPSLESVVVLGKPGPNAENAYHEGTEFEFQLHATSLPDTSANWELGGMALETLTEGPFHTATGEGFGLSYAGASTNFCQLLVTFNDLVKGESEALLAEAVGTNFPIYDLARGCGGEPVALHLLASNNNGAALNPTCPPYVGIGSKYGGVNTYNAISADGNEIFFTTCNNAEEERSELFVHSQLFVRLDAERTLEVSRPLQPACGEVPCAGAASRASADFAGASEDGSRVFFTTAAPLTAEDTDSGNDLYMAQIGCPEGAPECAVSERMVTSLTQVSHAPRAGEAAEVQGVVAVAPDGSRAYFVARGVLSEAPNAQGAVAARGADNLYVYDGTGRVEFVGQLCSGHGESGTLADARCPSGPASDGELWLHPAGDPEAQTAGADGGFLVFSTYAQLTSSDTDTAKDVYRYDAAAGALDRVSGGEDGHDANGNNDPFDATIQFGQLGGGDEHEVRQQYELNSRAISEDGSRIVFTTAEPLSPEATNGLTNAYEWHEQPGGEGSVSLISGGSAEDPVKDVVIDPSGSNVFFTTSQGLVPQDTDGAPDVYDARLERESGFPLAPAAAKACAGDACQGPLTNPAPLLVPGSVSQAPGQNFAAPVPVAASTPKRKVSVQCGKDHVKKKGKCIKKPKAKKQAKKSSRDRRASR